MTSKQRALNMRMTDNRLNNDVRPQHKKTPHLKAMDMEKRRSLMGQKSSVERVREY